MASIEIKHVGPLAETGEIELKTVNLFIGKQGIGKSTLMKILCHCRWMEKTLMVENSEALFREHEDNFLKDLKRFHRFNDDYFSDESEINYQGACIAIHFKGEARIERLPGFEERRYNTKLSFIPSERNLLYAIKNIDKAYRSSEWDLLFNYIFEWGEAKEHYTTVSPKTLVVAPDVEYFFDQQKEADVVRLKNKKIELSPFYASSGIQSALPVEILADYIAQMAGSIAPVSRNMMKEMMEIQQRQAVNSLSKGPNRTQLSHYQSAQLFIEEPEQNLYPEAQWNLARSIVAAIKSAMSRTDCPSMVTLTTHSPYVLTTLNVLMLAAEAYKKDGEATSQVVPESCILPTGSIAAYYITEAGTLQDIVNTELQMISGLQLDGVSDWVDDSIAALNTIIYG
ncbi:MAG: ATP-binding protein [Mediterranea sp.]|jgi:predicted ATPase|nr:ATP-binding protein [Mediterranea sp.]